MLYLIVGIILGVIVGLVAPLQLPVEYSQYLAVIVLTLLDSLIGAIRSQAEHRYNLVEFLAGLLFYALFAVFIVYLGEKMHIDLYLGLVVVYVFRIMQNVGILREYYFAKIFKSSERRTGEG